jgi:hypothetical protein
MMRFTNKAIEEQSTYDLNANPLYQAAIATEYSACERRFERYGYWANKDESTKNMIKALRMSPWHNTPEEWARLHVTEAALKVRR